MGVDMKVKKETASEKISVSETVAVKKSKGLTVNIEIVSRRAQRNAGLDIPQEFGIHDVLKVVGKVNKTPQYVLWHNGEPVASETGGTDCIAYLYLKDGEVRGWSV